MQAYFFCRIVPMFSLRRHRRKLFRHLCRMVAGIAT